MHSTKAAPLAPLVLALMAHPDDAEIYCAGTLILLRRAGWRVHIATLSVGDCGSTSQPPEEIAARRAEEARRSVELIEGEYHCLDERDGFVVYDKPTLRKCVELMRRLAPRLVLTHSTDDYMMDHVMTGMLARSASFLHAAPNVSKQPLPPGACVPHLYYCDTMEGIDPLGRPVEPTTFVDITDSLEEKAAMLACHASQREWLRAYHGTDEYLDAMRRHAALRGKQIGAAAAEGFTQHRGHAYPRNDLLAEVLGLGS